MYSVVDVASLDAMTSRIEIIESNSDLRTSRVGLYRWRCSCGADTSGRWYGSAEQALKAADRHIERCED
jgi:hypothetical protein